MDWNSVTAVVPDAASLLLASLLGHFAEATDRAKSLFSTPVTGHTESYSLAWDEQKSVVSQSATGVFLLCYNSPK